MKEKPGRYGLQFNTLGDVIQVGRVSKDGTRFLDWEDKTQEFYRALFHMFGGYETNVTAPDGTRWIVRVEKESSK